MVDRIFYKVGIFYVCIYEMESDDYNGMVVGMNVGRLMVILISVILIFLLCVIEGILVYEVIYIKKCDVLLL